MILLRFLLAVICILYIIRVVVRLILPMLFQSLVKKAGQQYQQGGPNYQQQRRKPEGSIQVDFIPPKDKEAKAADKAGDFIDYEEIR